MKNRVSRAIVAVVAGGALAAAAACGSNSGNGGGGSGSGGSGGGSGGGTGAPLVFGTTDTFTTADPAAAYDQPGWFLLYNTAQTLLSIPPGGTQPVPDAAKSCKFDDPKTYSCTMKPGLKFSDGSPLTSKDVKFSMDRMLKIKDKNGPWSIFSDQLASTDAPNPSTVTFHLKFPDATWPLRLTTAAASIVPDEKYSGTKVQQKDFVGSGPYKITKWQPSQQIQLMPNPNYKGDKKLQNSQVLIQKFANEAAMKSSIESKQIQVAYRTLSPTLIQDLEKNGASKGVKVVKGAGVGISYTVFNANRAPFDKVEVRQAFAAMLDRPTIASKIYNDTVVPLYSMVPKGFDGHVDVFAQAYGKGPNVAKAKQLLTKAGVKTPVSIQLWYNTDHYGEASADMYAEIERELEAGGLFKVQLKTASWDQYQPSYADGAYQAYQLGWYPDFPDADNYLSPFYATNGFIAQKGIGFSDPQVNKLLDQEKSETSASARMKIFEQIQKIGAEKVPMVPTWQDQMIAAERDGVTGVEKTFDPLYTFRLWLVNTSNAK